MTTRVRRTPERPRAVRWGAAAWIAAAVPALLLTGCSSGDGDAPATAGTTAAAAGADTGSGGPGQDQAVKFAACLRGHGIDIPDPKPGQGLAGVLNSAMRGSGRHNVQQAVAACRRYLPAGSGKDSGGVNQKQLELASCLRAHGIDVPDPKPGQGLRLPKTGDTRKVDDALRQCTDPARSGSGK